MHTIKFTKMQAAGNDFVVIDDRSHKVTTSQGHRLSELAVKLCNRRFGIGADGILLLEKSKKSDFRMRIFNPDGSEAQMCGNGLRCIAVFAHTNKMAPARMSVETEAGILGVKVKANCAKIHMTKPSSVKLGLNVSIGGKNYEVHYINTGVPHLVCYVEKPDSIDVYNIGRKLRFHNLFKPQGANVNFVKASNANLICIRTYERGVEAETLACGTGAVASALVSSLIKGLKSPAMVRARGGELKVYFSRHNNNFDNVFLEGEAKIVFRGEMEG